MAARSDRIAAAIIISIIVNPHFREFVLSMFIFGCGVPKICSLFLLTVQFLQGRRYEAKQANTDFVVGGLRDKARSFTGEFNLRIGMLRGSAASVSSATSVGRIRSENELAFRRVVSQHDFEVLEAFR